MHPGQRIVAVGGLHRSGTSLVARALAAHPDASGFSDTGHPEDEGQFLQTVFPPARTFGGPGRFGFDPRSHLTEESELVTSANRERLLADWAGHWDMSKRILVEKSPPNLLKLRFLQALLPGASFVVVLRHPIAVALATRKWSRTSAASLIEHWVTCHEIFSLDAAHVADLHLVRYEDVVTDPQATMAALLGELGIAPVAGLLEAREGMNERYFDAWAGARNPFRRRNRDRCVARFEERVARFGYSLADPPALTAVTIAGHGFAGP